MVPLQHSLIADLSSEGGKDSPSPAKSCLLNSLSSGVCFGHKYGLNLRRILLSSVQGNLGWMTQNSAPRIHSHSQGHCCSLPLTSLQNSFMQCWHSWTHFEWKTHTFAEVGVLRALHIAALPAAHLTKCWGTCSSSNCSLSLTQDSIMSLFPSPWLLNCLCLFIMAAEKGYPPTTSSEMWGCTWSSANTCLAVHGSQSL